MCPGLIHQGVLIDPANPGRVRPQSWRDPDRQLAGQLLHVLQHAASGPVEVNVVLEDHVHVGESVFRYATDPFDAGGREQGGDDRVRDLVLDQRRAPPWPLGKDDRLHIRQVRDRIQRHLENRPHPTSHQQ